jgi:hypothetical protein
MTAARILEPVSWRDNVFTASEHDVQAHQLGSARHHP